MPNGSLEKFIYEERSENVRQLGWPILYKIALGIARRLEYLHRGSERIVSMLGARGTIGYIAPEIVCRNLGGVSHKSDVYSYGMMVLEMVGGTKNVDAGADRTSEIYFPHWLYRRIEQDEELQLIGIMNEEKEYAKKMVMVSLCCIQTDPSNRPPMTKVVEMLEGNLDSMQLPPKPYLYSSSRTEVDSSAVELAYDKTLEEVFDSENFQSYVCGSIILYYNISSDVYVAVDRSSSCSIMQLPVTQNSVAKSNSSGLFLQLSDRFTLSWTVYEECNACYYRGGTCQTKNATKEFYCHNTYRVDGINAEDSWDGSEGPGHYRNMKVIVAGILILLFFFKTKISWHKCLSLWESKAEDHRKIEAFLSYHGSYAPKRYNYSEVKKITSRFKNKLGQGGYGNVYKGSLCNGSHVALKVLNGLKGNGEKFINEVASVIRTSHVNIVSLVGFCFEGRKRALVYEFMPNGSLEKFIYEERSENVRQLGWPTLYKIALGIARGLEYLHRGCTTRILHFDIKPHNILLDEDFCPKISDFGLAKLCVKKESILSMLGARGTIGYIAPETVCRNLGGVSHKSDVYSYGMMVLEMVGGRKNVDVGADRTSEIYFPHWLYRRIEQDDELQLIGIMNEEKEYAKKVVMVSLCCIQTDPSNRPSITKVVEMLEGNLDSMQIPPKPYLYSSSRTDVDSSAVELD
ncbi:putative receptor-like protein kinase [Capsicum chinense]|nr:putative receptor-like protein kinase [Capsicum chinense]